MEQLGSVNNALEERIEGLDGQLEELVEQKRLGNFLAFCLTVYFASVSDGDSQDGKLIVFDLGNKPIVADAIPP